MAITAEVSRIISAAPSRRREVAMIAERNVPSGAGAVPADFEQSIGELAARLSWSAPFEPFSDRFGNRFGHALSGNPSQLPASLWASLFLMFRLICRYSPYLSTILP